jgi:translation initiation factor IF-2
MDQAMAHVKPKKENISRLSFEDQETENNKKYLNLVVKADAFGSLEAIEEVIKTLPQKQ